MPIDPRLATATPPPDVLVLVDDGEQLPIEFPGLLAFDPWHDSAHNGHTDRAVLRIATEDVLLTHLKSRHNLRSRPDIRIVRGWGDIAIAGFERVAAVECKRALTELDSNLNGPLKERRRFGRALDALAANVAHPTLLLNLSVGECFPGTAELKRLSLSRAPGALLDQVAFECARRGIALSGPFSRSRAEPYRTGTLVLRLLLLPHVLAYRKRRPEASRGINVPDSPKTEGIQ